MSLKGEAYESADEVRFRLEGSVVLYDGSPVFISKVRISEHEDINEIARVFFYQLPFGGQPRGQPPQEIRKYLSSRKFDLAPFRMGYFNHEGEATFASRIPARQNKQGLTEPTCVLTNVLGKRSDTMTFNTMISSQGFVDMVAGKFPTFTEALAMMEDPKITSVAVGRAFAFRIDHELDIMVLRHKGTRCAVVHKGQKALRLPQKFLFLREEAEECRIPLA